jgi:hypothetical protein
MPIEIVLVGLLLVGAADFNYFTWWGILIMEMALIAERAPLDQKTAERVHTFWLCISLSIALGVAGLSWFECSMLQNMAVANGPQVYAVGNFLLHYWPSIRAVSLMPMTPPGPVTLDAATAATVFVMVFDPAAVYGCAKLSQWQFMFAGTMVATVVEVTVRMIRM